MATGLVFFCVLEYPRASRAGCSFVVFLNMTSVGVDTSLGATGWVCEGSLIGACDGDGLVVAVAPE